MFFFLHFMHVDPSKSCTLGLWTCTNRGQTRSERSVSIPFSALCLTNDVHVNVKPTVCGRFVNRNFDLRFERPAESSGNISRCRPLLVRRRSSSSSEMPIVELSCARGPAPPHPTLHPPSVSTPAPSKRSPPHLQPLRLPHRVLFLCRLSAPGSSPAASLLRISVPLLLHLPINRHPLVEWLHICSQPFTDPWISVFN